MTWIERFKYLDAHKHKAGWFLAVLFCYAWLTKKSEPLTIPAPLVVNQEQASTQANKTGVRVEIRYKDRLVEVPGQAPQPLPCPDITAYADSTGEQTHWQSQGVSLTAQKQVQEPISAILAGGGYLDGPVLSLGYRRDILTLQAIGWTDKIGGLATVDLVRWK